MVNMVNYEAMFLDAINAIQVRANDSEWVILKCRQMLAAYDVGLGLRDIDEVPVEVRDALDKYSADKYQDAGDVARWSEKNLVFGDGVAKAQDVESPADFTKRVMRTEWYRLYGKQASELDGYDPLDNRGDAPDNQHGGN